jgi:hypothetical protein
LQTFSHDVAERLERAHRHAIVLRQLVEGFSPADMNLMGVASRRRWQPLMARHARGAQQEIRSVYRELTPVFCPAASDQHGIDAPVTDLRQAANEIFQTTAATQRALWNALSPATDKQTSAQLSSPAFWTTLKNAEQLASNVAEIAY